MLRRTSLSVAALAAAALLLESALTRLLAVAQYYHFAFLVVSLALLGFGASGSFLSLRKSPAPSPHIYRLAGAGFAASTLLAYAAVNWLPFDSYTIAWERRQLLYFAPLLPGPGAALFLQRRRHRRGAGDRRRARAPHLRREPPGVGAWACCWRLIALTLAGVPGAVLASALIGLLPAVIGPAGSGRCSPYSLSRWIAVAILIVGAAGFGALAVLNAQGRAPLGLVISPYKGLAYALRYPGAETVFGTLERHLARRRGRGRRHASSAGP